ncbi:MAG: SgcJ/EcaC family oxidoreductase [Kiritimatiellae bacterium]|nr:SgcJ/EcaC family oxidoreductase [Kiritimatiellia bacterium]
MSRRERREEEAVPAAIDERRDAHVAALNAGDAEACAAQFTENGVQMPPNMPANEGRSTIQTCAQALVEQYRSQFALTVDEVRVAGDWAFERGGYTNCLTPHAGGPGIRDVGKYIMIYERDEDGAWWIACDIWNSDSSIPLDCEKA